jgi:hypothetical protein
MRSIVIGACILFTLVLLSNICHADSTLPKYPPASQMQVNVTFQPGLYEGDHQKFDGIFHLKADAKKYSLIAHDSLRTTEVALFLEDTHVQYVMSEFGEFGFDCLKYSNDGYTGFAGAFLPPFGFDMKSATYVGAESCGANKCDIFMVKAAGSIAKLFFEAGTTPNRQLVRVETTDKSGTQRSADFSNWQATAQDDSYFQIPPKARCHAP